MHSFRLSTKCARADNRKILFLGIVCAMVGSLLFGDWQAIQGDPCLSASDYQNTTFTHTSGSGAGSGEIYITSDACSITNSSLILELVERCETLSDSQHVCYWNRQSRVTTHYCYSCLEVCLSLQTSQNIYQFSMGVMLICISAALLYVFVSAIVSDITSVNSQVSFLKF